jgi:hypothetical protein
MKPLQILGREYSTEILGATATPMSVARLSESLDVPIATCYRRVSQLVAVGLLEEQPTDADEDSSAAQYRRTTDAVSVRFDPTPTLWARISDPVSDDLSIPDAPSATGGRGQSRVTSVGSSDPGSHDTGERPERVGDDA